MVQVDVFWSFALGAGFAASAAKQLKEKDEPFENKFFIRNLLYLSIFFVPSGAILLWGFPEWETMQAGTYRTIPAWLVGLFTLTNVTQGILGFWLAYKFIRSGNTYGAWLLMLIGYFCMFFILVHGWDGTGYQRFFYSCSWWGGHRACDPWAPGTYGVLKWAFLSPVAWTLYGMGALMMPLLFYWMGTWISDGYRLAGPDKQKGRLMTVGEITKAVLRIVFFHALGGAIVASLMVHWLGWLFGPVLFAVLAYFALLRKGGLTYGEVARLTLEED